MKSLLMMTLPDLQKSSLPRRVGSGDDDAAVPLHWAEPSWESLT